MSLIGQDWSFWNAKRLASPEPYSYFVRLPGLLLFAASSQFVYSGIFQPHVSLARLRRCKFPPVSATTETTCWSRETAPRERPVPHGSLLACRRKTEDLWRPIPACHESSPPKAMHDHQLNRPVSENSLQFGGNDVPSCRPYSISSPPLAPSPWAARHSHFGNVQS